MWRCDGGQAGFLRIQHLGGMREAEMMFQGLCELWRNSHEWGEGQGGGLAHGREMPVRQSQRLSLNPEPLPCPPPAPCIPSLL